MQFFGLIVGLLFSAVCLALPAVASTIEYDAILSGLSESPPNASPATGMAQVFFDTVANTFEVAVSFSNLLGSTTASHIHCCTASSGTGTVGVATTVPTFPGFPLGVTSGTYDQTFDMLDLASYNPAFVTANGGSAASALATLLAGMDAGKAYFNIHTLSFPGGEIRGFLAVAATPLPSALPLFAGGLGALGLLAWRRRRKAALCV